MWCEMRSCRQSSACLGGDCERAELCRYHEGLTRERDWNRLDRRAWEKTGPGGRASATACSRPWLWTLCAADDRDDDDDPAGPAACCLLACCLLLLLLLLARSLAC